MKILVTGGAGYIGSHTVVELQQAGHDVVVIDNFSNSSPVCLQRIEQITGKAVPFYEGDVRDTELLNRIFDEHKIDWVIHFAGLKAVGESVEKPVDIYSSILSANIMLKGVLSSCCISRLFGLQGRRRKSNHKISAGGFVRHDPTRTARIRYVGITSGNPIG